jgi:hypothetical protein
LTRKSSRNFVSGCWNQDWAEWDREIERDAASGKLDRLMKQALADHAAGKSRLL